MLNYVGLGWVMTISGINWNFILLLYHHGFKCRLFKSKLFHYFYYFVDFPRPTYGQLGEKCKPLSFFSDKENGQPGR